MGNRFCYKKILKLLLWALLGLSLTASGYFGISYIFS